VINNRYKLLAQVAAGGMAIVYKAQDTMLNRIVAVKILRESFAEDPAFQKRFVREAQSAANLTHPNIVTIYDFGREGDRQYIVMEYVEGRDLKSIIRAEGSLPLDARWTLPGRFARAWARRIGWASSTATSSRRTCSSRPMAAPK